MNPILTLRPDDKQSTPQYLQLARKLEAATTPAFQFLRMISPLSWMPVVVMLMGVGDQPIYFLLGFAALWPILLNTAAGVRQLDPRWLMLVPFVSVGVVMSLNNTPLGLSNGLVLHAWLLTAYLEKLATGVNADLRGATGRLQLDGFGNVLRVPGWSRFAGGVPVPLGTAATRPQFPGLLAPRTIERGVEGGGIGGGVESRFGHLSPLSQPPMTPLLRGCSG